MRKMYFAVFIILVSMLFANSQPVFSANRSICAVAFGEGGEEDTICKLLMCPRGYTKIKSRDGRCWCFDLRIP